MRRAVFCLIPHHDALCEYVQSAESGVQRSLVPISPTFFCVFFVSVPAVTCTCKCECLGTRLCGGASCLGVCVALTAVGSLCGLRERPQECLLGPREPAQRARRPGRGGVYQI